MKTIEFNSIKPDSLKNERTPVQWAVVLQQLSQRIDGDVRADRIDRWLASTDASFYSEEPIAVVRPKSLRDFEKIISWASEHKVPVIPRGGATSLAGQVVGAAVHVDCTRYLDAIPNIAQEDLAKKERLWVECAAIQDDVNDAVASAGLCFGPDTSTSNRATIGGMIGNNACGEHSILHGTTRENIHAIRAVLDDGSSVVFENLDAEALAAKCKQEDREGQIYRETIELLKDYREAIEQEFPGQDLVRRNTGYALDDLIKRQPFNPNGEPFSLVPLLCGSEGTLCCVHEAELALVKRPTKRGVLVISCGSVVKACEVAAEIVGNKDQYILAALELIDQTILAASAGQLGLRDKRWWINDEAGAVLVAETYAETDEDVVASLEKMEAVVEQLSCLSYQRITNERQSDIWYLRKAGLGILMGMPGKKKAQPGLEDAAVRVKDLANYVRDMQALFDKYNTDSIYYAHASVGLLHIRPNLDMSDPQAKETMAHLLDETRELVRKYDGSLSGEHGDGRLRAAHLERLFGDALFECFTKLKQIWDPKGILNPFSKIVPQNTLGSLSPLRQDKFLNEADAKRVNDSAHFDWSEQEGLLGALQTCNGAGACKKTQGRGVMCPSYHATKEELHSTRGRANVLRQLVESEKNISAFESEELREALDLCLSCKACASECPAGVDMARLKAEALQQYFDIKGTPYRAFLFGHIATLGRIMRWMPQPLQGLGQKAYSGAASLTKKSRWLEKTVGIDARRSLPAFKGAGLRGAIKQREKASTHKSGEKILLWVDEFSENFDPEIVLAGYDVLNALGYQVQVLLGASSARAQLSRGLVRKAAVQARETIQKLKVAVDNAWPIIGLEPSAFLGVYDEFPDLMKDADDKKVALRIKEQALLFEDFLLAHHQENQDCFSTWKRLDADIAVHTHCHAQAHADSQSVKKLLELLSDKNVSALPNACCGMAGSFGYEPEHFDVSQAVGESQLFPAVRALSESTKICAHGHSCRHQMHDALEKTAEHPAQILAALIPK